MTELSPPILNSLERTTLRNCETTIERGCLTFIEVGKALADIRDGKLYIETHKTFKAYCQAKWGFTDRRARQLMSGAAVVENVESGTTGSGSLEGVASGTTKGEEIAQVMPSTERQTRPLAELPEDKQVDAWDDAVEDAGGQQPTAAQVEQAAEKHKPTQAKPPDTSDRQGYYDQWKYLIGPLEKMVDRIAADVGEDGCQSHETIMGQLEAASDELREWMRAE